MSDNDLQLDTLRRAFAQDTGEAAGGCPSPELLWAGARGKLPEKDLEGLLDHLAVCSACATDWRLAAELVSGSRDGVVVPLRRRDPRRFVAALTSIAAAGLLVVVGLQLKDRRDTPDMVARRGSEETPRRSVVERETLSRDHAVLRWSEIPGAHYEVTVRTPDLRPVASAIGLTQPEFLIPAADLARFPDGTKLHWQVVALRPDGNRVPSAVFAFELR